MDMSWLANPLPPPPNGVILIDIPAWCTAICVMLASPPCGYSLAIATCVHARADMTWAAHVCC